MNRFEQHKADLSLEATSSRISELARTGLTDEVDRKTIEQLRLWGLALRPKTEGHFMMRVRVPGGRLSADQAEAVGEIARDFGRDCADVTARGQLQLRWIAIGDVPAIFERLRAADLVTLQTLMDSVRNICGCPLAGRSPDELFDASEDLAEAERLIVADEKTINLPKKMNVAITGCRGRCCRAHAQDLALVPAKQWVRGEAIPGYHVLAGGKIGGKDHHLARPLDVFLERHQAAEAVRQIVGIFEEHGPRKTRSRARLVHLLEMWGIERFRSELEQRMGVPLPRAGEDMRRPRVCQPTGILPQRDAELVSAGLIVPVGRIGGSGLVAAADLARRYGSGELRLTGEQNVLIPDIPRSWLAELRREPLLDELPLEAHPAIAGTQSCTGSEYCSMAAIETKTRAADIARALARRVPGAGRLRIHWSACHAGCGQHAIADIGLVGRRVQRGGESVEAVDIYLGNSAADRLAERVREQVPCDELLGELVGIVEQRFAMASAG